MQFEITARIETDGRLTLNGADSFVSGMAPADLRGYCGAGVPRIFRRDVLRNRARDFLGIEIPRGAKPGTVWTVRVDDPELWGGWRGDNGIVDHDTVAGFDDPDAPDAGFFIVWPEDDRVEVPVTAANLVA